MISKIKKIIGFSQHQQIIQIQQKNKRNDLIILHADKRQKILKSFDISLFKVSSIAEDKQQAVIINDHKKEDLRKLIIQNIHPFCSIGLVYVQFIGTNHFGIQIQQRGYGTAFLIQNNIALTAAHNIYSKKHRLQAIMAFVTFGLNGKKYKTFEVAYGFLPKNYKNEVSEQNKYQYDYAVLILNNRQDQKQFGHLSLYQNYDSLKQDQQVHVYGYPQDLNKKQNLKQNVDICLITRIFGCSQKILKLKKNLIYHNVDTNVGQSGSPILIKTLKNEYKFIGVHNGGSKSINHGSRMSSQSILKINKWIRQFFVDSEERIIFIEKDRINDLNIHLHKENLKRTKKSISKANQYKSKNDLKQIKIDELPIKTIILGDSSVEKSFFILTFLNQGLDQQHQFKMGLSFTSKTHQYGDQKKAHFSIWNTVNIQKYRSINQVYYRDSQVALCIFDITNKNSFEYVKLCICQITKAVEQIIYVIIGSNVEKADDQEVPYQQSKQLANSVNGIHKWMSIRNAYSINQLFNQISLKVQEIRRKKNNKNNKSSE